MAYMKRKIPAVADAEPLSAEHNLDIDLSGALFSLALANGNIDDAIYFFKEYVPRPWPKKLRRYIANKQDRIATGDLSLAPRRTPRRSSKLSDARAREAALAFAEGIYVDGQRCYFWDYKEVSKSGSWRRP